MKLTTQLMAHFNYGSQGGAATYRVLVDGAETPITYHYRTGGVKGKGKHTYTQRFLAHGEEQYDLLTGTQRGAEEWITAQIQAGKT